MRIAGTLATIEGPTVKDCVLTMSVSIQARLARRQTADMLLLPLHMRIHLIQSMWLSWTTCRNTIWRSPPCEKSTPLHRKT